MYHLIIYDNGKQKVLIGSCPEEVYRKGFSLEFSSTATWELKWVPEKKTVSDRLVNSMPGVYRVEEC